MSLSPTSLCKPLLSHITLTIIYDRDDIGGEDYVEILADDLLSFVYNIIEIEDENILHVRVPNDLIFIQDDALCHKMNEAMEFLKKENLEVMQGSVQSFELNPVEMSEIF